MFLSYNAQDVETQNIVMRSRDAKYCVSTSVSPARHSRVYVHADKFENLRFKSWRENCSQNTAGIQETTNTRELWLNSFMVSSLNFMVKFRMLKVVSKKSV